MVPGVDHPVDKLPLSAEGVELQDFIIAITRTITTYINIYCTMTMSFPLMFKLSFIIVINLIIF